MRIRWTFVLAFLVLGGIATPAQELTLTRDSEFGFRQIIDAAQRGELGEDVSNANVGVRGTDVRIELVRMHGANKLLFLTYKHSTQSLSRYFDIELGEGATEGDAARVGKLLDEAFRDDPFEVIFDFFGARTMTHLPTLAEAWKAGGWTRVLRVLEGRFTTSVGVSHAAVIISVLAISSLAGLVLLWGSKP